MPGVDMPGRTAAHQETRKPMVNLDHWNVLTIKFIDFTMK